MTYPTAAVELVAAALWQHEAERFAPSVAALRTSEAFSEQSDDTRSRFIGLANQMEMGAAACIDAIRAIHALADAELDAAALEMPKVRALVEWLREKTRDVETHDTMYDDARADIYVGEILERLSAITPTAVDDSAGDPT